MYAIALFKFSVVFFPFVKWVFPILSEVRDKLLVVLAVNNTVWGTWNTFQFTANSIVIGIPSLVALFLAAKVIKNYGKLN